MNNKEVIEIIDMAIAEVEWDYTMEYAAAFDMAKEALQNAERYKWHNLKEDPDDTPEKYDCDWVLIQIVEDNGYKWIPKVGEYRAIRDDWYCEEANGWLKDSNGLFNVVAWKEIEGFFDNDK